MNPVIMAGGMGERFKGNLPKPLMVVGERPVLLDALYKLGKMAFRSSDIYVVVNEHNRAALEAAIGDPTVNIVVQKEITGPATAVMEVYEADMKAASEHGTAPKLDVLMPIQVDDIWAFSSDTTGDFARFHERTGATASMALLANGDPRLHYSYYDVDQDGMFIGGMKPDGTLAGYHEGVQYTAPALPRGKGPRGCNAGIYAVARETYIAAYEALQPHRNTGIPDIIRKLALDGEPVAMPVYDFPYVAANDLAGLEAARIIHRQELEHHEARLR